MSDCTDPNCGEHINCVRCGDTTNHAPDYFPPELDGYCPECAVNGMEAGWLPKPNPEAMFQYILGAIENQIIGLIGEPNPADPGWKPVGPATGNGQSYIVTQCLN